jgi:hypothetical protein
VVEQISLVVVVAAVVIVMLPHDRDGTYAELMAPMRVPSISPVD